MLKMQKTLDKIERTMLENIAGLHEVPEGAYSLRINGKLVGKNSSENIIIEKKTDKPGIDIYIKDGTKNESMHIPVILSETGITETVYNDFHIGENVDVVIVAGCGIHNCGTEMSEHSGIHSFFVGKNSKVKYVEKHYGESKTDGDGNGNDGGGEGGEGNGAGDGKGRNVMNPTTVIELSEGAYMEMETAQIRGIDSTDRKTSARLAKDSTLVINEKIMTHGRQFARTEFEVELNGDGCGTHVVSRSVARDFSNQLFISNVKGNAKCNGHTECDAIIMDSASVKAIPEIEANNTDASLIHEAAIGKIAGEQIIKLMTLGLDEKQAEEEIINGFLK